MARQELSFHPYVKLLGYLSLDTRDLEGALVEIGVWKGKSLALMSRIAGEGSTVVGIDPCELQGQEQELTYFHQAIFPECRLVQAYSQYAIEEVLQIAPKWKLLHIDGGHSSAQVWADFLLYERFVVDHGYIVFDDYGDAQYSPEVGPAVDRLRRGGLFAGYDVLGQPPGYENSYVLKKCVRSPVDEPEHSRSRLPRLLARLLP
jgi:hypothetical protein